MAWSTPKTDWKGTDKFYAADWLRIVNNVKYIADIEGVPYTPKTSVTNGQTVLTSKDRNDVMEVIEKCFYRMRIAENRGYVLPRVDYGSTWNSQDLNIIENLLLTMKGYLEGTVDDQVKFFAGSEISCGDTVSAYLL